MLGQKINHNEMHKHCYICNDLFNKSELLKIGDEWCCRSCSSDFRDKIRWQRFYKALPFISLVIIGVIFFYCYNPSIIQTLHKYPY